MLVLYHAKETADLWYGGLGRTAGLSKYLYIVGELTKFELTYDNSINP